VRPSEQVLTIDELASAAGTTTRRIRSLQTLGLLPHPELRGRTGLYGDAHRDRLAAILRLQGRGFSLESLAELFRAHEEGRSLAAVLGVPEKVTPYGEAAADTAELYGFGELEPVVPAGRGRTRPALLLVPTTVWDESAAAS
jgi:DNA-binding transcriptional MerR regulator